MITINMTRMTIDSFVTYTPVTHVRMSLTQRESDTILKGKLTDGGSSCDLKKFRLRPRRTITLGLLFHVEKVGQDIPGCERLVEVGRRSIQAV